MEWWTDNASSAVENYEFPGYILTMPDGTEYRIDRDLLGEKTFVSGTPLGNYAKLYGPGRLTEIKSRSGDTIQISTNRIDHRNPTGALTRSIWFQRDEENRIVAINDPISGIAAQYLQRVVDNHVLRDLDPQTGLPSHLSSATAVTISLGSLEEQFIQYDTARLFEAFVLSQGNSDSTGEHTNIFNGVLTEFRY